jgi:hypothetical protein
MPRFAVQNSFREVLSFRSMSSDLLANGISKNHASTLFRKERRCVCAAWNVKENRNSSHTDWNRKFMQEERSVTASPKRCAVLSRLSNAACREGNSNTCFPATLVPVGRVARALDFQQLIDDASTCGALLPRASLFLVKR